MDCGHSLNRLETRPCTVYENARCGECKPGYVRSFLNQYTENGKFMYKQGYKIKNIIYMWELYSLKNLFYALVFIPFPASGLIKNLYVPSIFPYLQVDSLKNYCMCPC